MLGMNVIRTMISMITIVILIQTFRKHYYSAELRRVRNMVSKDRRMIFNSKEFPAFLTEFIIMLIHYPPFLDNVKWVKENSKIIFPIIGLFFALKLVFLFELIRHYSSLNTNKGRFVGSLSKIPINTSFLIKTWLKMNPVIAIPMGAFWFLIIMSYLLYLTERSGSYAACYEQDAENQKH